MSPTVDTVTLSASVLSALRMRQAYIAQQEHTLACLKQELMGFLAQAARVDLAREHWELDATEGTLRRLKPEDGTVVETSGGEGEGECSA